MYLQYSGVLNSRDQSLFNTTKTSIQKKRVLESLFRE